jgi:hypothetical protein
MTRPFKVILVWVQKRRAIDTASFLQIACYPDSLYFTIHKRSQMEMKVLLETRREVPVRK